MSTQYNFESIGLGISFPGNNEHNSHPNVNELQNDYREPRYVQQLQHRARPSLSIRSHDLPSYGNMHQRAQSAILPQRSTFERLPVLDDRKAPSSAHPSQRPFPSPSQRFYPDFAQSAPTTPSDNVRVSYPFQYPQTEHRDHPVAKQETVRDRRQRRQFVDSRPPPQYRHPSQYMDSPIDTYSRGDTSSNSGSSYFYMTPSVQSTPFSEAGHFPVPEPYGSHSSYNTPHLMYSPVFESGREQSQTQLPRFVENQHEEMPEEPYVPTMLTSFPPLRPSALRRRTTDESKVTTDEVEDPRSLLTSPISSADSPPPTQKDRKVAYSRWTSSEDLLLKEAITRHGDGKWSLVSQMVPGRTPMQCSTRWQGALNTSIHKGRWDPEEDQILIKSVAEWQAWHLADNKDFQSQEVLQEELYKNIPWSNIAQLLPRPRTGVQALARWSEALDPRITKGKWTSTEDAALLRGIHKYGKCWIKIANCVKGRTQRQCRTRYCQISDKKRKVRGGPVRGNTLATASNQASPERPQHFSE